MDLLSNCSKIFFHIHYTEPFIITLLSSQYDLNNVEREAKHQTIIIGVVEMFLLHFQSMLRTCCLRQFGYFLSRLEGLQFTYNEEKGIFIGPTQPTATDDSQEIAMEKMVSSFRVKG